MIVPQGKIRLIHCPLTLDNKNQLYFKNEQEQYDYFSSLDGVELDSSTYVRRDNVIRFNDYPENIMDYNYCMYQNTGYSTKWFYAFVTRKEYVNDNMCYVYIETDSFQTWHLRMYFKPTFIEREMIENDVIGANLIPENVETGEHIPQQTFAPANFEPVYIVAYADDDYGHTYNGIFSGIKYYAYSDISILRGFLIQIKQAGKDNLIQTIFTVPKMAFYPLNEFNGPIDDDIKATPYTFELPSRPTSLMGYTPKNNKLLTYPFTYVTFNQGGNVYRFEDFQSGKPKFKAYCELNINPEIKMLPFNYLGFPNEIKYNVATLTGYPTISWSVETYNVWLAQNTEFINLRMQQATQDLGFSKQNNMLDAINLMGGTTSSLINSMGNPNQNTGNAISSGINSITNAGIGAGKILLNNKQAQSNYDFLVKNQVAEMKYHSILPDERTLWR